MRTIPQSAARWICVGLALFCLIALVPALALRPATALADTDLDVGGQAHIAYADGDAVRLRYGPGYSNDVLDMIPEGTTVDVTDGPFWAADDSVWYKVSVNGEDGYVVADYLAAGPGSGSADNSSADTATGNDTGDTSGAQPAASDDSGVSKGQAMVDFAEQYLGYPYVWATHGPDTFDCSGFTYWVALNVLGIDIGTGTEGQVSQGTPVDESNLQPGDLVFFQNTFEPGISHVGIYISDGQFIHAENPDTGVVISNLNDPYYAEHYYGAIRIV